MVLVKLAQGQELARALGFSGDLKLTPSVVRGSTQH